MLLRLLLMVTWAAWIWFEVVIVVGPSLMDRLRGRGRPGDTLGAAVLLAGIGAGAGAAIALARLGTGPLPGPVAVQQAAGLALMWAGLAIRAWPMRRLAVTRPAHAGPPPSGGALLVAAGFGVALGRWTGLVALLAAVAAAAAVARRARLTA
jgi:hypothetical protein